MDKNARNALIAYIGFIFFIFFISFMSEVGEDTLNNPFDYARITDVEYKAIVLDEPGYGGKLLITERLTFDIHAASSSNLFWELWRDLPEDTIDGLNVDYEVYSVKQILDDGTEIVYTESPKLYWYDTDYTSTTYGPGKWYHSEGPYDGYNNYECLLFYVDGLYREEVTFEIEYVMNNASFRYDDCSELYVTLFSDEAIRYLESYRAEILFADKDMPSDDNYEAYSYGTNAHVLEYKESDARNPGYHTFIIDLDKEDLKFRPYNQYIEFALISYGSDKHIFTEYAPDNYYSDDEALQELRDAQIEYLELNTSALALKKKTLTWCLVITAIIVLFTILKIRKIKKKYTFYEPEMNMEYFRDIPSDLDPYFAAALVFSKDKIQSDDTNGYSAIMLSLVRKGYIELQRMSEIGGWDSNNIKIVVKYKPNQATQEKSLSNQNGMVYPQVVDTIKPSNTPIFPTMALETRTNYIRENQFNTGDNTGTINSTTIHKYNINDENRPKEALTINEEAYFNLILRHSGGNEVTMTSFQQKIQSDYNNTDTFVRVVENSVVNIGVSQGYFQKANYRQPYNEAKSTATLYIILSICVLLINIGTFQTRLDFAYGAFFILGITLIICSIYLKRKARKYTLLTQYGENEYAKWRALYNFLNSETLMNERTVLELPLWEKYLVYATAFGISEKVIKALEIRCPNLEMSNSTMLRNHYYRSTNFRSSCRTIRTSTHNASVTSRGGFSGSGHYGGGGRGGGGGGGGH